VNINALKGTPLAKRSRCLKTTLERYGIHTLEDLQNAAPRFGGTLCGESFNDILAALMAPPMAVAAVEPELAEPDPEPAKTRGKK
jgi:hypothetical protein